MRDRAKYMSDAELKQLRDHARANEHPTVWLLVDLATQTGLRVSELAKLRPKDFDFDLSAVYVVRAKRRRASDKERSPELLLLSPEISGHVLQFVSEFKLSPDLSLWPGQRGRWSARGLQQAWLACCRRAGLSPKLSIKAARHTMGVRLLRQTGSLGAVKKQLGHSSVLTTYLLYGDRKPED